MSREFRFSFIHTVRTRISLQRTINKSVSILNFFCCSPLLSQKTLLPLFQHFKFFYTYPNLDVKNLTTFEMKPHECKDVLGIVIRFTLKAITMSIIKSAKVSLEVDEK